MTLTGGPVKYSDATARKRVGLQTASSAGGPAVRAAATSPGVRIRVDASVRRDIVVALKPCVEILQN